MKERTLGIIGGSGLYDLPDLQERQDVELQTPFGEPSDALVTGRVGGVRVAFLARHGKTHRMLPHELPYRANIHAMKQLGMECVIGISAVGSMRDEIHPGDLVLVDQFIDRTSGRTEESTFFGNGCVAHAPFADPIWEPLRLLTLEAAGSTGARVHDGGTYLCMEGPHLSTRAESNLYRSWGVDVIGMTNLQEAKLAREAELAYTTVALVTDYDCWHETEDDVSVSAVLEVLRANAARAKELVGATARLLGESEPISAAGCMRDNIITPHEAIPPETRQRLELLIGKYGEQD